MMNSRWNFIKAKYLLTKLNHPSSDSDGVVTAFRDGEVVLRSERRMEGFTEATEFIGYQGVKKGELVVHSMDAFAGAIGISKSDGRMSPVVHIYKGRHDVDLRFYAYYLRHLASAGYIQSLSKGIRERSTSFDAAVLRDLELPFPPIEDQRRIADYLDLKIPALTKLISVKASQIDLLRQFSLEMTEKILFPDSILCEPSGISNASELANPFSSNLPENWRATKFRYIASNSSRRSGGIGELLSVYLNEGVIPFALGGRDRVHNPSEDMSNYQVVSIGNLVMNNQQAWRGSVGVSPLEGIVSPAYHVYRLSNELIPEYANLLFRSRPMVFLYEQVSRGVGSIQRNLDSSALRNIPIVFPDRNDQMRAIEEINTFTKSIKTVIEQLELSISKIEEFRASLLSNICIGNFDKQLEKELAL